MDSLQYEVAAGYIARFLSFDRELLDSLFGHSPTPSSTSGSSTYERSTITALREAETLLKDIIAREFDAAAAKGDDAAVQRFFQLFPQVGAQDRGLERYGDYVCMGFRRVFMEAYKNALQAGAHSRLVMPICES
jgi:hypothetical protein